MHSAKVRDSSDFRTADGTRVMRGRLQLFPFNAQNAANACQTWSSCGGNGFADVQFMMRTLNSAVRRRASSATVLLVLACSSGVAAFSLVSVQQEIEIGK